MRFMRTDHGTLCVAGKTAGAAECIVGYGLIEIYLVFKQGQNEEKVAPATEGKRGVMPVNRA
jgi:hypothetical protein